MTFIKEEYEKKFCFFDEISIPVYELPEADHDLKRILSYHPIKNREVLVKNNVNFEYDYLYDPSRDIIETDRTGFRHYDRIYTHYISKFRDRDINLLEIGIEHGYGLLAWSRYFKNSLIYGMEVNKKFYKEYDVIRKNFPSESKRIQFSFPYSSTYKSNWNKLYSGNKFDVIIDDGSHKSMHQIETLINSLNHLKDKNVFYFIEDLKLEYLNNEEIVSLYSQYKKIKERHSFKEMTIYRHVNPERISFLNSSKEDKVRFYISRNDKERIEEYLNKETGNHYNYMIVFSK